MTWGAIAVGTGAVINAVSSAQNSKRAEGEFNTQMGLQQQNVDSAKQFQQQQDQMYGPLNQQMIQQASSDQPLFYGPMQGQINQSFDQGQRNLTSQMAQRGMAGSGLAAGGATNMEIGRSGALDTAFQQGLQSRLQLGQSVLSRYQPMLNQSMVSGALQGQSGVAGQQGQMYNQAAQQGMQSVGSAMSSIGMMGMMGAFNGSPGAGAGDEVPAGMGVGNAPSIPDMPPQQTQETLPEDFQFGPQNSLFGPQPLQTNIQGGGGLYGAGTQTQGMTDTFEPTNPFSGYGMGNVNPTNPFGVYGMNPMQPPVNDGNTNVNYGN